MTRFLAPLAMLAVSASTAPSDFPALGQPSYTLTFARDVPAERFGKTYPGLATWGYFGAEPVLRAARKPMTPDARFTSRAWPGTLNVNVDPDFCPGATTPDVKNGALRLTAYRLAPADTVRCGHGRAWASAYVSSQPSFAQTYGYFEIEGRLPCVPGRWPAFWLLPTAKTPANGGRLAEVDVFEHYGGPITVMSQGRPFEINRVGQPFSTLHYGTVQTEQAATNARSLPAMTPAERAAFCAAGHSFGVLWTPESFRFFIDRRETFRTPNPGVDDPHYWVVNMDVAPRAGDVASAPQPSTFAITAIRAWKLPAR